ncbi:MAG: TonB-dependent receptor, partial [Chitinophagaceae bacterium]
TPGALTLAEYAANNRQARPAAGAFPSAVKNKAAIYQKTLWAGLSHHYAFNKHFENQTSVYLNFSTVKNPAVRNYEERNEPGLGARTVFSWKGAIDRTTINVTGGGEFQQGYPHIRVANNKLGNPDSLQTADEVKISQAGVFLQAELNFTGGWIITAGASLNTTRVFIDRVSVSPVFRFESNFHNEVAPRVSLLKKLTANLSVYALASKGFSPPTVAELLPSTTVINTSLQAEQGVNVETGIKGSFIRSRVTVDINTYSFRLQNTIAQRRDASGGDYFVNTGNSRQKGVEAAVNMRIIQNDTRVIRSLTVWTDYTYQHFRYGSFKQLVNDFSGKQIPGTTPNALAAGLAVVSSMGIYANINFYYSDHIYLNDANSAVASPYQIAGFRGGYRTTLGKRFSAEIYVSGDNVFDERYSLGNDINAAANRYYNVATGRNFQGGVIFRAN